MTKQDSLIGRWAFVATDENGDEIQYKIGEITGSIGDRYLIRMRAANGAPAYSQLDDLAGDSTRIFDDEATLDEYIAWMFRDDGDEPPPGGVAIQ